MQTSVDQSHRDLVVAAMTKEAKLVTSIIALASAMNDGSKPFLSFLNDAMHEKGKDPAQYLELAEAVEETYERMHRMGCL